MMHKFLISITLIGLALRLYQLDSLPGEMWGDAVEHYKMAQGIMQGSFFTHYAFGGDGPLFSYAVALISFITGLSFYSIKLTSALLGTLLIPLSYSLAALLFPKSKRIPLFSASLTAISFWAITFSRQGKPYILVPLILTLTLIHMLKRKYLLAGIVCSMGMYSQAAFWGAAALSLRHWKILLGFIIGGSIFLYTVINGSTTLTKDSYIGQKFGTTDVISRFTLAGANGYVSIRALWQQGDVSFRHTIPGKAHLDPLSGIFLVLGIIGLLHQKKESLLLKGLVLFIILQIPAWMDIDNPHSSPNMGRSIAIIPLLFIGIAVGIDWIVASIKQKALRTFLITVSLVIISAFNMIAYFQIYPLSLPNQNTPYGALIAQTLERDFEGFKPVLVDCCWADAGQPEPMGIFFQLTKKSPTIHLEYDGEEVVDERVLTILAEKAPTVFIVRPTADLFIDSLATTPFPYERFDIVSNHNNVAALFFFHDEKKR